MTANLEIESTDPVPAESGSPLQSSTPGSVLRQTREARGQSIADVVQVIRFSARQIEALERDDYASLPGSTAVRGLVRNYAKFLKLDASPLLAQLEPAVPVPQAEVRPPANMGEAEQPGIVERISPRIVVSVVFLLILALAGWYLIQQADWLTAVPGAADNATGVARNPATASAAPAPAPVAAPAPAATEPAAGVAALPPAIGLRVEFDDRSWIEIRDATQKVVFVGEYPAGTRQNVEGTAPFQLWIGKASGVRVFLGERSIDLKPHTREDIARFSVE